MKGLWGGSFLEICRPGFYIYKSTRGKHVRRRKSAGQRSTYTIGLGSLAVRNIQKSTRGKDVRRRKSAGQRSTYTFGLGSLLYVAKNLQARGYVQRDNENIGSGGTWSSRKTDGGRWWERYPVRSLYVLDTVRTRGVRNMAIGGV